jgi:hypothetical protein
MKDDSVTIRLAAPIDGESAENLILEKFANAVQKELRYVLDYKLIDVIAFEHDGTGEDSIDAPVSMRDEIKDALEVAVSNAFSDPDNYDL